MNVSVKYLDQVRFEAEARGHRVICDQPESNNGANSGMTPPEFLLVSLGSCAAYYAVEYLRTRNLPTGGLEVNVEAGKKTGPARLGEFRVRVRVAELDERHRQGVLRAIRACIVHNTLCHLPAVEVEVEQTTAAA
ncbi:MAG: OsmC family protein [Bryobacterales bacterium]|nr:OsmC family protein [Bryobacterales bacterium]